MPSKPSKPSGLSASSVPPVSSTLSNQTEASSVIDSAPTGGLDSGQSGNSNNASRSSEAPIPASSPSATSSFTLPSSSYQSAPASAPTSYESSPSSSSADHIVETLHRVDQKVETMRQHRLQDPDTLGDKIFKIVLPTVLGALAGKVFKTVWDSQVTNRHASAGNGAEEAQQQGFIASVIFAAASAAFGSIISTLGTRGSNALVTRRQNRRSRK